MSDNKLKPFKFDASNVNYYDLKKVLQESSHLHTYYEIVIGARSQEVQFERELEIIMEMFEKAKLFDKIIKHLRIQGNAINYVNNYLNLDDEVGKENKEIAERIYKYE